MLKQLHFVYLIYPSATHTRFSHSIGTMYVAKKVVKESKLSLTRKEKEILFISALLHDIGHSAFGHIIEHVPQLAEHVKLIIPILNGNYAIEYIYGNRIVKNKYFPKIDIGSISFIHDVLKKYDILEEIKEVFSDEDHFLRQLISNYIDVDHLDYLKRDSFFLGYNNLAYDNAIFNGFLIEKDNKEKKIVFRNNKTIIDTLEGIIYSRYFLFKNAYYHHTAMAANAMVNHAVKHLITKDDNIVPYILGDESLLRYLVNKQFKYDKNDILMKKEHNLCKALSNRLILRNLVKRVYFFKNYTPKEKQVSELFNNNDIQDNLEKEIMKKTSNDIIFYKPMNPPIKDYERILIEDNKFLFDVMDNSVIDQIKKRYNDLEMFYIFSLSDDFSVIADTYDIIKNIYNYDPSDKYMEKILNYKEIDDYILKDHSYNYSEEYIDNFDLYSRLYTYSIQKNIPYCIFYMILKMESNKAYKLKDLLIFSNEKNSRILSRSIKYLNEAQIIFDIYFIKNFVKDSITYYYTTNIAQKQLKVMLNGN